MDEFKTRKVGGVQVHTHGGLIHVRVRRLDQRNRYVKIILRPDQAVTAADSIIDALEHLKQVAG